MKYLRKRVRSHEVLGARICAGSVRRVPVESPVPVRVRANAVQYALVVWSSGLSPHSVVGLKEVMLSFLNQADQKVFCFSLFVIHLYPAVEISIRIHHWKNIPGCKSLFLVCYNSSIIVLCLFYIGLQYKPIKFFSQVRMCFVILN